MKEKNKMRVGKYSDVRKEGLCNHIGYDGGLFRNRGDGISR